MRPQFYSTVSTFPLPYPGETIYSLVVRYHIRSGNASFKRSVVQILNNPRPRSLGKETGAFHAALTCTLPANHPLKKLEHLLYNHTTLPFHLYFDQSRVRNLSNIVEQVQHGKALWFVISRGSYNVRKGSLTPRFCLECVRADRTAFGVSYWHREHQVRGVAVCAIHGTVLVHTSTTDGFRYSGMLPSKLLSINAPLVEVERPDFIARHINSMQWISQQVSYILDRPMRTIANNVADVLLQQAALLGHTHGSQIDGQCVSTALMERFGEDFCNWLGASINFKYNTHLWFRDVFRRVNRQSIDPLKALLLVGVYFRSVGDLENTLSHAAINPDDPPVSNHLVQKHALSQSQIEKVLVDCDFNLYRAAKSLGLSRSKLCTAIIATGARCEIRKAANTRFGSDVMKRIIAMLKNGSTRSNVMKNFSCSYSLIDSLVVYDPTLRSTLRWQRKNKRCAIHRAAVETFLREHPHASRTDIRSEVPTSIEWLTTHDREWLKSKLPARRRPQAYQRSRHRLDWTTIDRALTVRVQDAAISLFARHPPVRVTATALLTSIGEIHRLVLLKSTLPMTKLTILSLQEDLPTYHKRRLSAAIANLAKSGHKITLISLFAASGVSVARICAQAEFIASEADRLGVPFSPQASKKICSKGAIPTPRKQHRRVDVQQLTDETPNPM